MQTGTNNGGRPPGLGVLSSGDRSGHTHRISYLRNPTLVPWKGLQAQLGADYARPRDFRRAALTRLEDVVAAYPELRIRGEKEGIRLYPSPPHITSHPWKRAASTRMLVDAHAKSYCIGSRDAR
jgi:hypothetical protein